MVMVSLTFFLLIVLFIAGFINIYFCVPSEKFYAWLQSFLLKTPQPISMKTAKITPQVAHEERMSSSCDPPAVYDKAELKSVFATFDKNGDGFITREELRESFKNISIFMTEKEVEEMVLKVDSNGDGLIDFEEFCILCKAIGVQDQAAGGGDGDDDHEKLEGVEEGLKDAFGVFDKDKDGLISVEELGLVLCSLGLNEGKRVEDCREMIRKVDMDGDGMVNFAEFKKMMMKGTGGSKLVPVF